MVCTWVVKQSVLKKEKAVKKGSQRIQNIVLMVGIVFLLMAPITSFGGGNGISKGLLKDYSAKWWQWSLSIPAEVNPLGDTDGSYCSVGQQGDVWFLGGTLDGSPAERSCTIPYGKKIFFPIINAECSVIEGYGETNAELSTCAKDLMDHVTEVEVLVDGVTLKNVKKSRVQSKPFEFSLPPGDTLELFGEEPNPSRAVSDGWWVLLPPLPEGEHVIVIYGVAPFPEWDWTFEQSIKYNISIVKP